MEDPRGIGAGVEEGRMSAERGEIVTVGARAIDTFGRFVVSARQHHFVSDTRASTGGPGEAVQAGELLLSALASCGLGLVQKGARERGATLRAAEVEVSFERDPEDKTRYTAIRLAFVLEGVAPAIAQLLLEAFTGHCPIYNTLRRGGPIEAAVTVRA
ncbi:MAG: hypothetical protein JWQ73_2918 [Variovorax sp.]|jgi:uncharacterized OsmC-like protein|nr:hypothetical protein [Variovorax sp.]